LKTKAFELALNDYSSSKVRELIAFHKRNGGVSRYKKFEYFFSEILKVSKYEEAYLKAISKFSEEVVNGMEACSLVSGVKSFLDSLKRNQKDIYIVSGADQDELVEIIKQKNIFSYFKGIYGSPGEKVSYIEDIKREYRKSNGIFFGDSFTDFQASQVCELDFIYVRKHSEWTPNNKEIENMRLSVNDFKELMITNS
tara:strand:+ start:18788 stop:19378 length:591 start_codon:yes stop_codon:yes gene_type:complete